MPLPAIGVLRTLTRLEKGGYMFSSSRLAAQKLFLYILSISALFLTSTAYSQSWNDPIRALKKLEAKVEVGISYRDYLSMLGETKFEIKQFEESNDSGKFTNVRRSVREAFYAYEIAGVIWEQKINLGQEFVSADNDFGMTLLRSCPGQTGRKGIAMTACMSELWSKAAKETESAAILLRQLSTSPKKR